MNPFRIYPPEVKGLKQSGNVNQVDFATNVVIPEHDEAFAELQTGRLLHGAKRRGTTASSRTAAVKIMMAIMTSHRWVTDGHHVRPVTDQSRSGATPSGRILLKDLHQDGRIDFRWVLESQLVIRVSQFRLNGRATL